MTKNNYSDSILLTTDEVASILKISRASLFNRLRTQSDNPASLKIGKRRYFPSQPFYTWLNSKIEGSQGGE